MNVSGTFALAARKSRVLFRSFPARNCGHPMNRTVNGSGAGEWLLRDATKPRGVRKVEPRSPARRSAESCHQPVRRVARAGSKARGWLRRADQHRRWTGNALRSAHAASGVFLCPSLRVSPESSLNGDKAAKSSQVSTRRRFNQSRAHFSAAISAVGGPLQKFSRDRGGVA